jgi:hypothetical protein
MQEYTITVESNVGQTREITVVAESDEEAVEAALEDAPYMMDGFDFTAVSGRVV